MENVLPRNGIEPVAEVIISLSHAQKIHHAIDNYMKKEKILKWKFLREVDGEIKSNSGDLIWEIGKAQTHKGKLELCNSGLHASDRIYQAFGFIQGEILAQVECSGRSLSEDDKSVWSKMKIVKAYKWQKKDSVALSIYAAELCIKNFEKIYPYDKRPREAIEAAKRWLNDPTKENESAARSAESAAWSAAGSAESAAWSAARSAESAARSAESAARSAESAARSVAESAARSAESAAGSAARSAESAARSAESAAGSAAWSAAGSAVVEKISIWMEEHAEELEAI